MSTDPFLMRVKSRLNALLLVTKSCAEQTCRDPWSVLQPCNLPSGRQIRCLQDALNPDFDDFFASFPSVTIDECLPYQLAANEGSFYPPGAELGLGMAYRSPTDNFEPPESDPITKVPNNTLPGGSWEQRHATLSMLLAEARDLTDDEIWNAEDAPTKDPTKS